ncbi:Serine-arginine protein 55 [Trichinella pseudospiralis]|nr:Serine-arginine protein 55 [Trichinella pseudospiralis]
MESTRVYVGQLTSDIRENDLENFFKGYGRIREITLKNGYGFVEFDERRDADDAVHDLNGKPLMGEKIRVEMAHRFSRDRFSSSRGGGFPMENALKKLNGEELNGRRIRITEEKCDSNKTNRNRRSKSGGSSRSSSSRGSSKSKQSADSETAEAKRKQHNNSSASD